MSQLFMRRPNLDDLPDSPALPSGSTLRAATEADADALAILLHTAFSDADWTPERVRRELLNEPTVKKTLIIENGGMLTATASARLLPTVYPGSGYVHWVAVSPAAQGQKLGTIISLAVLHEFVQIGCKDAVLETDDHRIAAIRTYQKLGFVPENRHESHPERWAIILSNLAAAINL